MSQTILFNLAINLITNYIKSSDSSKDDEILKVVQKGAKYLSAKDNNDITAEIADTVVNSFMKR